MVHPKVALTLAAIAAFPTFVIFSNNNLFGAKDGALLHVNTKADGANLEQTNYSWEIKKTTETKNLQLRIGDSYTPTFNIEISKGEPTTTNVQSAEGEVCIKNQGKQGTVGLQITNTVQYKEQRGNFKDIEGAVQTINPEQIAKNSRACFPLNIDFTSPREAKHFRVATEATITNPAKRHRERAGGHDTDSFRLPKSTIPTTNTATVTDSLTCPEGYKCTPSQTGPWTTSDNKTITYSTLIENISADCDTPVNFENEAKLTESSTQNTSSSKSTIPINTGPC